MPANPNKAIGNQEQFNAIQALINELKRKHTAYVILSDILDDEENTVGYMLHYNSSSNDSTGFYQYRVTLTEIQEESKYGVIETRNNAVNAMKNLINDLLFETFREQTIVIRSVIINTKGEIE